MYDFSDRTLLLTGANGGIGRQIAHYFYRCGANLVLADLDGAKLQSFADSAGWNRARASCLAMDASNAQDADRVVSHARDHFGGIDFLAPCAGIYYAQPIREMSDSQWRETLSVNLDGVFYICTRAIAALRENSSIVNLTSVAAHRGAFYNAHYSASKGGLLSLTRSLARELGPRTRVNAVSPGVIETPMAADLIRQRGAESAQQSILKRLGRPEEVASVVAFLCSDAASFITAEVIHVNGGLYVAG